MLKISVLLSVAALLAGCFAATPISSTPASVAIDALNWQTKEAMDAGQKECRKHGRDARLTRTPAKNGDPWIFDCV